MTDQDRYYLAETVCLFFAILCCVQGPADASPDSSADEPVKTGFVKPDKPTVYRDRLKKFENVKTYRWRHTPGTTLIIGIQNQEKPKQIELIKGYTIRNDTERNDVTVEISIVPPDQYNQDRWLITEGYVNPETGGGSGSRMNLQEGQEPDQKTEDRLLIDRHPLVHVPLNLKKTQVYMVPLRRINGDIQKLLLMETTKPAEVKNTFDLTRTEQNDQNPFITLPKPSDK